MITTVFDLVMRFGGVLVYVGMGCFVCVCVLLFGVFL